MDLVEINLNSENNSIKENSPLLYKPQTQTATETDIFYKYIINNSKELAQLNTKINLKGSILFTYDSDLVGVHKLFFFGQIVKNCGKKEKASPYTYHAMICVGWNAEKDKPVLSHSVQTGVRKNSVDYFEPIKYCGRGYKTATQLIVYVPKDEKLRQEFFENAQQSGEISTKLESRSFFHWGYLFANLFRKQLCTTPSKSAQKDLAYLVADRLLNRKISPISNENKTLRLFCTQYVTWIFQASILMQTLSQKEKNNLALLARNNLAKQIYKRIKFKKEDDLLSKTYWESRVCTQIIPKQTASPSAALLFDKLSTLQMLGNL